MKLAIAQINTTIGRLEGNVASILDSARSVADQEPDLIIFPEMVVSGYPPRDILYDTSFVDAVQAATLDLVRRSKGLPPMLVGSFAPSGQKLYEHPALKNIAYLIQNGELKVAQIKQLLPIYDVFYEPRWFVAGTKTVPPIDIAAKKIGVLVCEDMWDEEYPIHPGQDLKKMGAEMLICISASPYRREGTKGRLHHAARQGLPLVFVNLVGGNDELIFDGGSFVLGGDRLKKFEEEVRVIDLSLAVKNQNKPNTKSVEEVFRALTLGVRDFAQKNGLKHAFIGLSGGVDSSVAAVIATEALGADNLIGIAIPSRFTDPRSTESAQELSESLGIRWEKVELEKMHFATEHVLGPERSAGTSGENIQARLRMIILMSYVNQEGGFLINTSNKTELTLGYSTLYGDMSGAISPLGDLTKPEVYELARWINSEKKPIPDFVMSRKPSAELRAGQIDPFDYGRVSPEVEELVQRNQSNSAMRTSEHKRWQMGVILKVNEKSFGKGRMMPITRR
jgi:NAD+ synthase (glutamine-hydrolysing)